MDGVAMPIPDLVVIHRFAHLLIQLHGATAVARAREMAEKMRRKGDHEGADTWLYIVQAMSELGGPINLVPEVGAPCEAPIEQRLRRVYYGRLARVPMDIE